MFPVVPLLFGVVIGTQLAHFWDKEASKKKKPCGCNGKKSEPEVVSEVFVDPNIPQ